MGERFDRATRRGSGFGSAWGFAAAAALLVGAALRFYRLAPQVLTGDELHSVVAADSLGVGEILRTWTYQGADYCVPMTALFRALGDAGIVLGEWQLRVPALLCGLVLIAFAAAWSWRRFGPAVATALAWLLAVSPLLVIYSRLVRSYMPVVFVAGVAAAAFLHYWREGKRRWLALYATAGALAVWLHLGAAPFVAAPLVWALAAQLAARLRGTPFSPSAASRLAAAALAVGALSAALLAPAARSLLALRGQHGAGHLPDPDTWLVIANLLGGSTHVLPLLVLAFACTRGAVRLARRDPGLLGLIATAWIAQVAGLGLLHPNFLEDAVVASRYLLVLLPATLLLAALGIADGLSGARAASLTAGAIALLLATGPFVGAEFRTSTFVHAPPLLGLAGPANSVRPQDVPPAYRELLAKEAPGAVLEVPWLNAGSKSLRFYQSLHRREVRMSPAVVTHLLGSRFAFRNFVSLEPDAVRASGARFALLHRDLHAEEARVITSERLHAQRLEHATALWQTARVAARRSETALREAFGEPIFDDGRVALFALDAPPPPDPVLP